MPTDYGDQKNVPEWHVFARNCGSDESCCRDFFRMTKEPLTIEEAAEFVKNQVHVWHEYCVVHQNYISRYESKAVA